MGPGIVILVGLIAAGIFAAVWIISLVTFLLGWWKKSRVLSWLGGVPLCGLSLIATFVLGLISLGIIRGSNPKHVYEDTFREKPSSDVSGIQSDTWYFADGGHTYLRFQASSQTFQRIRPKHLSKATYEECRERVSATVGDGRPSWWVFSESSVTENYFLEVSDGKGKSFASELTMMSYDTNTSTVLYYFLGID